MWTKIKAWFAARGGWFHVVAGAWAVAVAAYAAVPAFHQLVLDVWAVTPPIAREVGLAITGLLAWYTSPKK